MKHKHDLTVIGTADMKMCNRCKRYVSFGQRHIVDEVLCCQCYYDIYNE